MANYSVYHQHNTGANLYFRVFGLTGSQAGQVLDFSDNAFKALASATTPYQTMTEYADLAGNGLGGYSSQLDLSEVNATLAPNDYQINVYNNASPSDIDNPIARLDPIRVQNSRIDSRFKVEFEINVKSTAGSTAQLTLWLEDNDELVAITDIDASPTCSVVAREHASASNLFTANGSVSDIKNNCFEYEQSSPAFTDDRNYIFLCSITVDGVTITTQHAVPVIG